MLFNFATITATALALLSSSAFAAPTELKTIQRYQGEVQANSYIVKLKDSASKNSHLGWLEPQLASDDAITHGNWSTQFFNGYAGKFDESALNLLRSSPDVDYIEEVGIVSIKTTQTDAPWGIARLSQTAKLTDQNPAHLTFTYTYNAAAGSGVDVYVIDTGIYTSHSQFEGRAKWGKTFGGYADQDGNGHGTHVSGTVGGVRYGVAKKVSLIAVKVLSDSGSGTTADVVSGMNYALTSAQASGRPSVATMSLGGSASTTIDNAAASLTAGGVHLTVAAGNDGANAANSSPARAPSAITVGATTIADAIASFSNYGAVVDVFAPGVSVISSWIGSTTATNSISGTSMATPHVAGLVAYLISVGGNTTPAAMSTKVKSLSVKSAITGIPSGTLNDLARNDQ